MAEINCDDINWNSFDKKLLRFYNFDFISTWDPVNCKFDCINIKSIGIPVYFNNLTNDGKEKVNLVCKKNCPIIGYIHTNPRCFSCGEYSEYQICGYCLHR